MDAAAPILAKGGGASTLDELGACLEKTGLRRWPLARRFRHESGIAKNGACATKCSKAVHVALTEAGVETPFSQRALAFTDDPRSARVSRLRFRIVIPG